MLRVYLDVSPIDVATADEAAEWTLNRLRNGERTSVAAVNASIAVRAHEDSAYCEMIREFDLVLADGLWPAMAASILHHSRIPHTNTSPFLRALFTKSEAKRLGVFLLGAQREVVGEAASQLSSFLPQANVLDFHHGYFTEEDETDLIERINASGADILLVGMSTPMKEQFVRRHWLDLNVGISVGVGGLFDVWAGKTREAPDLMRRLGLEWVYRLVQEPRRLFFRYTVANSRFVWLVLKQLFRKSRRQSEIR